MSEKIIGVIEAARILDMTLDEVRDLLEAGEIDGYELGNQWSIKLESVLEYRRSDDEDDEEE